MAYIRREIDPVENSGAFPVDKGQFRRNLVLPDGNRLGRLVNRFRTLLTHHFRRVQIPAVPVKDHLGRLVHRVFDEVGRGKSRSLFPAPAETEDHQQQNRCCNPQ